MEIKKKKKKDYWGLEEEEAVKKFLLLPPNSPESDRLFENMIYEPLKKLVENIMFTYKIYIPGLTPEEQIMDTISFIAWKMRKFDPSKQTKSFSYYGTIAKNYMMAQSIKQNKMFDNTIDIENVIGFEFEQDLYENHEFEKEIGSYSFLFEIVANDLEKLMETDLKLEANTYKLCEAVIYLLKNYQSINVLNKRQFYFIAREFTGLSAKEITKAMKTIKETFRNSYNYNY